MSAGARRWLIAAIVGCAIVLVAASELLNNPSPSVFTRIVLAPVRIAASMVPLHNIGTQDDPLYEGTPLHFVAALAVLPFCALLHALVAYALVAFVERHRSRLAPGKKTRA